MSESEHSSRSEQIQETLQKARKAWQEKKLKPFQARAKARKPHFMTSSDIPMPELAGPEAEELSIRGSQAYLEKLGFPGSYPFTRGVYPTMYRGRLWTMRQYAGFGSAEESNQRYHFLLKQGVMGLSVAFDLPTQIGYDSDHSMALGEVGKVGVAISTLDDMRRLFKDIPLDQVSTSMTINASACVLLAMYICVAEEQGISRKVIKGTIQNDILKEYVARGTYIYPPEPSLRIITDIFEFCHQEVPGWNTISISGYHIREAGSTAAQEVGFTLAHGICYVEAALKAGLDVNHFAKRLSFFFNGHNNFLEEIAKFRAARRMWAKLMRTRFQATDPKAMALRFHTQTAGSTLTAQQPENNIARTTIQALAAVLGGTQSLHTNSFDEALALPSEKSAQIALRTQQIIAHESGVADTPDPFAGSYVIEKLTDELEQRAERYIHKIDELGGAIKAIEQGYMQNEITQAAFAEQRAVEAKESVIVGVNHFTNEEPPFEDLLRIDESAQKLQIERLKTYREERDQSQTDQALEALKAAARGSENLMPRIIHALKSCATLGEICDTLREVFGEYQA